jgi:hypothetical protein
MFLVMASYGNTAWDHVKVIPGHSAEEESRKVNDFIRDVIKGCHYQTTPMGGVYKDPNTLDEYECHCRIYWNE